ncbi:flagellar hook-associated protein 2 [Bacillus sp. REN10]|uniref:flagellar hook-associated protein 2 n=1 Tax=Bacillus sp. REN10 TaxID=2782541 RepID=UPI00193B92DA|nr:flagellar hook-associated protein 2 [Bacillus sp. REN10]
MRIGGLASGMDIDTMVKDLMKAERMKVDKLHQRKQFLEWQRDDYRSMNKTMFDFSQQIFDGVMKQANYIQKKVNLSDESVASIRNLSSTTDFQGTLEVKGLATAARMTSSAGVTINPEAKLSDLGITDTKVTINAIGKDGKLAKEAVEITFDPTKESLNDVMKKINEQTGVTMFYDSFTGKVSMTAKNTGDAKDENGNDVAEIELTDSVTTDGLFAKLNLSSKNTDKVPAKNADGTPILDNGNQVYLDNNQLGSNAQFTLNGLETQRSTNTFTIGGVEYSLKAKGTTNFTSATDVDKVYDTIKGFVDKYNELIAKVNEELDEKRYRSYQPLTKEQREAMSDKEAELWEEKARSGTLRGDSALTSGMNKMRFNLSSPVSGLPAEFNQLSDIGITTSKNYLEKGKLVIDDKKLKEAIAKDPNAIYKLFANDGPTDAEKGLARRLRATIDGTRKSVEQKAGSASSVNNTFAIGKTLINLDDQISRFERKLIQTEDRYWRQFSAMEKAIQRSNEQSMSLMNYFK